MPMNDLAFPKASGKFSKPKRGGRVEARATIAAGWKGCLVCWVDRGRQQGRRGCRRWRARLPRVAREAASKLSLPAGCRARTGGRAMEEARGEGGASALEK